MKKWLERLGRGPAVSTWGRPLGKRVPVTPSAVLPWAPSPLASPPRALQGAAARALGGGSRERGQWAGAYGGHAFIFMNLSLSGSLCARPGALPLLGGESNGVPDPQCGQPPRRSHRGEVVHGAATGGPPGRVRAAGRSHDGTAAAGGGGWGGETDPGSPFPSPFSLSLLLPPSHPSFHFSSLSVSYFPPTNPALRSARP